MTSEVVELFSGTGSVTKAFEEAGYNVTRVDIDNTFKPDLCMDILDVTADMLPKQPMFLWASVPCESFVVMAAHRNWLCWADCRACGKRMIPSGRGQDSWDHEKPSCSRPKALEKQYAPVSKDAHHGLKLLSHTIDLIRQVQPKWWLIENPRALMRKLPEVQAFNRYTITHCQYGDPRRQKPTDLFGFMPWTFEPKACKRGASCHQAAPRGSITTGSRALRRTAGVAALPPLLGSELLDAMERYHDYSTTS